MKKFSYYLPVVLVVLVALPLQAGHHKRKHVRGIEKLGMQIRNEVSAINPILERENLQRTSPWDFQNFYLRLIATVGFTVFFIAKIQVEPQIELVWHHQPVEQPKG